MQLSDSDVLLPLLREHVLGKNGGFLCILGFQMDPEWWLPLFCFVVPVIEPRASCKPGKFFLLCQTPSLEKLYSQCCFLTLCRDWTNYWIHFSMLQFISLSMHIRSRWQCLYERNQGPEYPKAWRMSLGQSNLKRITDLTIHFNSLNFV